MAQIQCPNCGGYKTYETAENLPYSERTKRTKKDILVMTLVGVLCFLGLAAYFVYAGGGWVGLLCLGGAVLLVILLPFALLDPGYYKKTRYVKEYTNHCELCGYFWKEVATNISVRPDLIALGAKRLEEEAAAERKRQEQMQAAWWLDQQRHQGGK